ncbi:MAG: hypothetical protein IKD88_04645 [Lachnospiraceae bacterium]|nr:hypothetical protein [Lachnospiraceae bacterium]MBR6860243.1 hypothetical protein [Acidaminococcaceae bacterium]
MNTNKPHGKIYNFFFAKDDPHGMAFLDIFYPAWTLFLIIICAIRLSRGQPCYGVLGLAGASCVGFILWKIRVLSEKKISYGKEDMLPEDHT